MAKIDTVRIAITRSDGGVSLMDFVTREYASSEGSGWTREPTLEAVNATIAKANLDSVSWRFIDKNEVPEDRTFRNAWKPDLTVDMPKARDIHRKTLRRARAPLLASLDFEFMRAVETNDTARMAEITAQKQALRDITDHPGIEAATTPEELLAIKIG